MPQDFRIGIDSSSRVTRRKQNFRAQIVGSPSGEVRPRVEREFFSATFRRFRCKCCSFITDIPVPEAKAHQTNPYNSTNGFWRRRFFGLALTIVAGVFGGWRLP